MKKEIEKRQGIKVMRRKKLLTTAMEMPFKAICPVPDRFSPYMGTLRLEYKSEVVVDFNAVKSHLDMVSTDGEKSVEDLIEEMGDWLEEILPEIISYSVIVDIPSQERHLHVTVMGKGFGEK